MARHVSLCPSLKLKDRVDSVCGQRVSSGSSEEMSELDGRVVYHMLWSAECAQIHPNKWTQHDANVILFDLFGHYAQDVMKDRSIKSGLYVPMIIGATHCLTLISGNDLWPTTRTDCKRTGAVFKSS